MTTNEVVRSDSSSVKGRQSSSTSRRYYVHDQESEEDLNEKRFVAYRTPSFDDLRALCSLAILRIFDFFR
jgi:hypothetical protein